jgi:primase-polymerase (primpol)-like protein
MLAVRPEGIPDELKKRPQWACWRWERRNGKWTKPPISPATGGYARNNDPDTWSGFEAAVDRMKRSGLSGVGGVNPWHRTAAKVNFSTGRM